MVRYLVAELNGSEAQVTSPSFALQHEYPVHFFKSPARKVEHWDLHRLKEAPEELYEPPDANTLRLIEWPERSALVRQQLQLLLHITEGDEGQLVVKLTGLRIEEVVQAAQSAF